MLDSLILCLTWERWRKRREEANRPLKLKGVRIMIKFTNFQIFKLLGQPTLLGGKPEEEVIAAVTPVS